MQKLYLEKNPPPLEPTPSPEALRKAEQIKSTIERIKRMRRTNAVHNERKSGSSYASPIFDVESRNRRKKRLDPLPNGPPVGHYKPNFEANRNRTQSLLKF